MDKSPARVLVCDDHELMRIATASELSRQSDMLVVGEAADAETAVEAARRLRPDVAVVDLRMPPGDGFGTIRAIKREGLATRIVVLSSYETYADADRALGAGADAYVKKEEPPGELVRAIRKALEGGAHLSAGTGARTMSRLRGDEVLSAREVEVLRWVMEGLSNREIGRRMAVSEGTVKSLLQSAFGALGVKDRTGAVVEALKLGALRIEPR